MESLAGTFFTRSPRQLNAYPILTLAWQEKAFLLATICSISSSQYLDDGVEEGQEAGIHFIDSFGSAESPLAVGLPFALNL